MGDGLLVPWWNGDLTPAQWAHLQRHAERTEAWLRTQIDAHPDWGIWREEGIFVRDALVAQSPFGRILLEYEARPALRDHAGMTYRGMLCALLDVARPALLEGVPISTSQPMAQQLALLRPRVLRLADTALNAIGAPLDNWHRFMAAALLIEPDLADWARPFAVAFAPPGPGSPEWARRLDPAGGISETVVRAGGQVLRALQHRHGIQVSPPPTPRGPSRINTTRQAFDDYIASRTAAGVSVQILVEDAEATRLYRAWKGTHNVTLTEQVIRGALKRKR